jgi:hypothetical protein
LKIQTQIPAILQSAQAAALSVARPMMQRVFLNRMSKALKNKLTVTRPSAQAAVFD